MNGPSIVRQTRRTKQARAAVTAERCRELIVYDSETGIIRSRCDGRLIGWMSNGYRIIRMDGINYPAHRIAWLYTMGAWPSGYVDHINGDKADNRISNLRDCTGAQNQANRGPTRRNKSGHKGIYFNARTGKYAASIQLGSFDNLNEAIEARLRAERFVQGEFAWVRPHADALRSMSRIPNRAVASPAKSTRR